MSGFSGVTRNTSFKGSILSHVIEGKIRNEPFGGQKHQDNGPSDRTAGRGRCVSELCRTGGSFLQGLVQ